MESRHGFDHIMISPFVKSSVMVTCFIMMSCIQPWSSSVIFVSAFSTTSHPVSSIHTIGYSENLYADTAILRRSILKTEPIRTTTTQLFADPSNQQASNLKQEAQELLAQAQKLRQEINASEGTKQVSPTSASTSTTVSSSKVKSSEWTVKYDSSPETGSSLEDLQSRTYRLYLDIGREEGTWMDPRWAASGRRIEGTLDILLTNVPASKEIAEKMVSDNQMGSSSACFVVHSASKARLKGGFDKMNVLELEGGYRVDGGGGSSSKSRTSSSHTLRFYVTVKGKQDGDVSIPEGRLYFSLPCFLTGGSTTQGNSDGKTTSTLPQAMLSNKEGIISVRQIGWHTGWRREESRILGVFRAVPIEKAQQMDRY